MKNLFVSVALVAFALSTTSTVAQPAPGPRGTQRGEPVLDFDARTAPQNDREKQILEVIEDVGRNQRRGSMIVPRNDGRLLRTLTEALDAKQVVELGTSVGYSGLWFALALESTGGKLVTFEINDGRARMARDNFKRAGVDDRVTLIEGDAHENVSQVKGPVDVVFLDADKEGYVDYLEKLLPKLRPGGLVIAHNMNQRQADPRYVEAITTNPDLETVFVRAGASNISITLKKRSADKN